MIRVQLLDIRAASDSSQRLVDTAGSESRRSQTVRKNVFCIRNIPADLVLQLKVTQMFYEEH